MNSDIVGLQPINPIPDILNPFIVPPARVPGEKPLSMRIGFEMHFELFAPTTMVLMLYTHPEISSRLDRVEHLRLERPLPIENFVDAFGNRCARVHAPAGFLHVTHEAMYHDTYAPEAQPTPETLQTDIAQLPTDALPFLLGSRYCEVDRLGSIAWDLFGHLRTGGERVLAINQWVFKQIRFGYKLTRPNKTALDTFYESNGVCRDMMHLAIAFCRALNIPARYASGYLGDIAADPDPTPMDFSAFYEVYLGGKWYAMDARHGRARVGRVLMSRGRDAADCALITSFGRHRLAKFTVITDEVVDGKTVPSDIAPMMIEPAPALALSA